MAVVLQPRILAQDNLLVDVGKRYKECESPPTAQADNGQYSFLETVRLLKYHNGAGLNSEHNMSSHDEV
jgi:hypothetical protein